jgi:uncharacterized protein (DUF433 family)
LTRLDAVSFNAMNRTQIVHSDPDILGGTPVFVGTRVPVQTLLVYIENGETIEEFLDNFPTVSKAQAVAFLEEAGRAMRLRRLFTTEAQRTQRKTSVISVSLW